MGEVPPLQEGKEHFRYSRSPGSPTEKAKGKFLICNIQRFADARQWMVYSAAQINDFGTHELIGRQKDRILPDCFLQKKRHEKVVWIFPPGHTVSSFGTIGQVLGWFCPKGNLKKEEWQCLDWQYRFHTANAEQNSIFWTSASSIFEIPKITMETYWSISFDLLWLALSRMTRCKWLQKERREHIFPTEMAEAVWYSTANANFPLQERTDRKKPRKQRLCEARR